MNRFVNHIYYPCCVYIGSTPSPSKVPLLSNLKLSVDVSTKKISTTFETNFMSNTIGPNLANNELLIKI